jgi:hypothetical protein
MKSIVIRVAIVIAVVIQVVWFISPSTKSPMGADYRNSERLAALSLYASDPTPANSDGVEREMKMVTDHLATRKASVFVGLLLLDAALVYSLWRPRKLRGRPLK